MIAERSCERIAMAAELAARRQQREHRGVDLRNTLEERDRLRAHRLRRGQRRVVPLEVEALPPRAEERVEADVVVSARRAHVSVAEEPHPLVADRLPLIVERRELRDLPRVE